MAKQVQKCPTIIRVHCKHGDTPLVQTTHDPDAHCLPACHWRCARAESSAYWPWLRVFLN